MLPRSGKKGGDFCGFAAGKKKKTLSKSKKTFSCVFIHRFVVGVFRLLSAGRRCEVQTWGVFSGGVGKSGGRC